MEIAHKQVIIIGGGPAGLAAAVALYKSGVTELLVLEREIRVGGVLNQCIHDGFGLIRFGEALSGPEYAGRFATEAAALGIEILTGCTVIGLTAKKEVTASACGRFLRLTADAVIVTTGCRERPVGGLPIPGDRPAGVFTAGTIQSYVNQKNVLVGKEAVILGSGDIGLIMARRLTLEGVKVRAVIEQRAYPGGLPRNLEQCLHDFNIPLLLSSTVVRINGRKQLESVTVCRTDEQLRPIPGTEQEHPCDTLILSAGLIPDNELLLQAGAALDPTTGGAAVDENCQTTVPGIFAAGNALYVHDLVDHVSREAELLADSVGVYLKQDLPVCTVPVTADSTVAYAVPRLVSGTKNVTVAFRPCRPMKHCVFELCQGSRILSRYRAAHALPSVLLHLSVKADQILSQDPIKVVSRIDQDHDLYSLPQQL